MPNQTMRETIEETLKKRGVVFAGIFGSYAKNNNKPESDVDLIVEFGKQRKYSLFDLGGIKTDLESRLGKKVDLITPRSISPHLRKEIMETMTPIYDNR